MNLFNRSSPRLGLGVENAFHSVSGLLIRLRWPHLLAPAIGVAFSLGLCVALWMTNGQALIYGLYPIAFLIRVASSVIAEQLSDDLATTKPRSSGVTKAATLAGDTLLILPLMLVEPFTGYWVVAIVGLVWLVELATRNQTGLTPAPRSAGPMTACGRAIVFGMLGFLICLTENLSPVFYWFQPIMCISLLVTFMRCMRIGNSRPTPAG